MAQTRGAAKAAKKWKERTAVAVEDYKDGINNPRADWAQQTEAAADTWKTAITEAANKGRFAKGVTAAGTGKWKSGAITKGADRYPAGVAVAEDDYNRAMQSVISTIEGVSLPKRYPKGDPRNIKRVEAIATALHRAKIGG